MTHYRDISIKTKLSLIALMTCVTALLLAFIALFAYEIHSFKRTFVSDLKAQSTILAGLSTAALTFNDVGAATEMLNELRNQPHVKWAIMYRSNTVFAEYRHTETAPIQVEQPPLDQVERFTADGLFLNTQVRLKGELIGSIYICADTSQLRSKLWEYGEILLAVFCASSIAALLMASRLQRAIVGPVQRLADTARVIAEHQDYTARVEQGGRDELGRLTVAFNHMLNRIQAQDAEVREGRERFEIAVAGARDGIWDWNLATNELYLSPQWKQILGYEPHEIPSTYETWLELQHPEDREATLQQLREYLEGKRPTYEVEFRMRHKDGTDRWILARGAALRDSNQKPCRMAGSHTDITERKRAEEQITRMQRELVDASRQAGMAEIATGVLHNVGNVLNSVNVSSNLLLDQLRKSKTPNLVRAVELMNEHKQDLAAFLTEDPKGRQLPLFFEALADHMGREQTMMAQEVRDLQQNIDHIKQIVAMQQSYAKVSGAMEHLSPKELVDDALRISAVALSRHRVEIVRQYENVPLVLVDRHKVLQILINLVSNAKQAMDAIPEGRRLTLRISPGQDGRVRIEVRDNGVGIGPENLTRIFNHGFTTKKSGHGFGLHSSANTAKEMGGNLTVESEGPGTGAVFILQLPIVEEKNAQRAA